MSSSAGGSSLALHTDGRESSDDRSPCLENPRPEGAESTLTENAASPFPAEPAHITWNSSDATVAKVRADGLMLSLGPGLGYALAIRGMSFGNAASQTQTETMTDLIRVRGLWF